MPAWKAALYFVAGLCDHVWLKGHFRLVKEDRVEVENTDFNFPLEEQKKNTVAILTSILFFCSSTILESPILLFTFYVVTRPHFYACCDTAQ